MRVSFTEAAAQVRRRDARALAAAMLEGDVSASELAAAIGVTERAVHNWTSGARSLSAARRHQIALALGVFGW